jgi:hypothetical protein
LVDFFIPFQNSSSEFCAIIMSLASHSCSKLFFKVGSCCDDLEGLKALNEQQAFAFRNGETIAADVVLELGCLAKFLELLTRTYG